MTRKQLTLVMFLQMALGSFAQSSAVKEIDMINNPAKNIADNKTQPGWVTGDKYEAAWKSCLKKTCRGSVTTFDEHDCLN